MTEDRIRQLQDTIASLEANEHILDIAGHNRLFNARKELERLLVADGVARAFDEEFRDALDDLRDKREPVSHYETPGGIECIDFLRSLGIAYDFSRGNAIKYLTRAGRKEGNSAIGDLKKARTYIDFMIQELEDNGG